MPAAPSYYDSIGLLAICDAIDTVEGIPFKPVEKPHPLPSYAHMSASAAIPNVPVAPAGKPSQPQHVLLSHIPVTGMTTTTGSIGYEEQQRVAINQLASTGQLPQQMPHHTIGGIRPSISVAHNIGASNASPRSRPSIPPSPQTRMSSPGFGNHPANLQRVTPGASPGFRGSESLSMSKSASPGLPPGMGLPQMMPPTGRMGMPVQLPPQQPPSSMQAMQTMSPMQSMQSMPMQPMQPQSMQPMQSLPAHAMPGLGPVPIGSPMQAGTRASTPGGPSSPMESPQPHSTEYRIEVCQICGRDFKGPKAATHKQQHIRRLHPTEYTPKRGGKKSRD